MVHLLKGEVLKIILLGIAMLLGFNAHAKEVSCKFYAYELMLDGQKAQKPFLKPKHVLSIKDDFDLFGQPQMVVRLNRAGTKIATHYSEKNLHKQIVIFCDEVELSRPYVQTKLSNLLAVTYTRK